MRRTAGQARDPLDADAARGRIKRAVPERIAEARGQLALGNVALALKASGSLRARIRTASMRWPASPTATTGWAASTCPAAITRARWRSLPADTQLLAAFAASLQLQGKSAEALSVREEISARMAAAGALESASMAEVQPAAPLVQVAAAETKPATREGCRRRRTCRAGSKCRSGFAPKPKAAPKPLPKAEVRVATAQQQTAPAALGPSVTIKLPPPRRVQQEPAAVVPAALPARTSWAAVEPGVASTPLTAPQPVPVNIPSEFASVALLRPIEERVPEPSIAEERGPRTERMSTGEIALITVSKPEWRLDDGCLVRTQHESPLRAAAAGLVGPGEGSSPQCGARQQARGAHADLAQFSRLARAGNRGRTGNAHAQCDPLSGVAAGNGPAPFGSVRLPTVPARFRIACGRASWS